jgi:hypothetical protein
MGRNADSALNVAPPGLPECSGGRWRCRYVKERGAGRGKVQPRPDSIGEIRQGRLKSKHERGVDVVGGFGSRLMQCNEKAAATREQGGYQGHSGEGSETCSCTALTPCGLRLRGTYPAEKAHSGIMLNGPLLVVNRHTGPFRTSVRSVEWRSVTAVDARRFQTRPPGSLRKAIREKEPLGCA